MAKRIDITIEKTKTGYSAFAEDLNVFSTGKSISELYENLLEALNLYFEEEKKTISSSNIRLNLDFQQFFQYYRVLNAKFLAERIGMNPTLLSQYVQGKKKPSEKQTDRILKGIQNIGEELAGLNLNV